MVTRARGSMLKRTVGPCGLSGRLEVRLPGVLAGLRGHLCSLGREAVVAEEQLQHSSSWSFRSQAPSDVALCKVWAKSSGQSTSSFKIISKSTTKMSSAVGIVRYRQYQSQSLMRDGLL